MKDCLIISPIGPTGSEDRRRSDLLCEFLYEPSLQKHGYKAIRADRIDEAGVITHQVIRHLLECPLVIADLASRNANVFYELGIRHAVGKPFIHVVDEAGKLPFDVATIRTVEVDHNDVKSFETAKGCIVSST